MQTVLEKREKVNDAENADEEEKNEKIEDEDEAIWDSHLARVQSTPHSSRDAATVSLSIPRNRTEQNERLDMINHNRAYSAVLASLAAVAALSSGLLLFLAGASSGGRLDTHLPDWSLPWVAVVNFAYAIAIVVVLCARRFKPESGRRLTRLLNWALLPALPGGTLVGIYGLWRVDKATG
jgi:hypothetical protein